ncbi:MAG: DUF2254 domain-containing protein [Candidatus Hydrogenedens sp.]|nr:DUF2254 domain-containing protein [Candidatus Hydrogenedens sp.]
MRIRLLSWLDALRSSYWFVPNAMAAVMFTLAFALPALERRYDLDGLQAWTGLDLTAGAAQTILSTITSANVSIVGVVFSITILTLSIASSQMGPRLVRTFMAERSTHFALGLYLSTAAYCLIVLAIVDEKEGGFVPRLSVVFALVAAVGGLGFLIYFIHRIARMIQAPNIVEAVAAELDRSIERLFPEVLDPDSPGVKDSDSQPPEGEGGPVLARGEGYIQAIDYAALLGLATRGEYVLRIHNRPGHFVMRGLPIAEVLPPDKAGEELDAAFDDAIVYGYQRTPWQDLECAISELVEVAVRALSPGVNDPFTAITCVDRLGATLARLAERKIPGGLHLDDDGHLRVIADPETFSSALNAAFNQIRQNGRGGVAILIRIMESLRLIAAKTHRPGDCEAIRRQADMVLRAAEREVPEENDQADIRQRYDALIERLQTAEQ